MSYPPPDNENDGNHNISVHIPLNEAHSTMGPYEPDPELRSQINAQLLRDGHIDRIKQDLSHALSSSPSNLPTKIRQHALHLLRTDSSCTTFPALMARVLADVRADTNAARREEESRKRALALGEEWTGTAGGLGGNGGLDRNDWRGTRECGSLEVPREVVEEGVRLVRESLDSVVEVSH